MSDITGDERQIERLTPVLARATLRRQTPVFLMVRGSPPLDLLPRPNPAARPRIVRQLAAGAAGSEFRG